MAGGEGKSIPAVPGTRSCTATESLRAHAWAFQKTRQSAGAMDDFDDLLAHLENEQDDLEAQREALWPRYVAFREGLYQALIKFCTEAQKRGLLGVKLPMIELEPDWSR